MKPKILAILTFVSMVFALYMIFIFAPRETAQGDAQRIMYIHVPLAIMGYVAAILMGYGSIRYLKSRASRWDRFAQASAEVGVALITAQLLTAIMWARPIWGPWWVWDGTLDTDSSIGAAAIVQEYSPGKTPSSLFRAACAY